MFNHITDARKSFKGKTKAETRIIADIKQYNIAVIEASVINIKKECENCNPMIKTIADEEYDAN